MTSLPSPPAPPRSWVRFQRDDGRNTFADETRVTRYRIESVSAVLGAPLQGLSAGDTLLRLESTSALPEGSSDLIGVTQHLSYMRAPERAELASPPESGPIVVVIPISKSAAWWSLAQDERDALFRGAGKTIGHPSIGQPHVPRIHRKLYHGRYLSSAGWDFLTYFEFAEAAKTEFQTLVATLRDVEKNPEWRHVEREAEVWLRKV